MASNEEEANIPEFNTRRQVIPSLCSLISISGLYVVLLYMIIKLSLAPETNLPSFNKVKHKTLFE